MFKNEFPLFQYSIRKTQFQIKQIKQLCLFLFIDLFYYFFKKLLIPLTC